METVQNPDSPTAEAPDDTGSLDAAARAFEQREQPVPEEGADAEPAAEAEDDSEAADPDAEALEADTDEDSEGAELAEVEYEGKTYKVPPELQKALLRQSDYSRKMNEVKALETGVKQRAEQAETLVQGAGKLAQALAQIQMIDARLQAFEKVDWQSLRQEDPAQYAALATDLQTLRLTRAQAESQASAIGQEVNAGKSKALEESRAEMFKTLAKDFKGWGNEAGERITAYATQSGVKLETLQTLTDPAVVIALEKARKFDELQAKKPELKAKAKALPPVLKPGAPRKADATADAMTRLRKSNSVDDAAALFLAKMR